MLTRAVKKKMTALKSCALLLNTVWLDLLIAEIANPVRSNRTACLLVSKEVDLMSVDIAVKLNGIVGMISMGSVHSPPLEKKKTKSARVSEVSLRSNC